MPTRKFFRQAQEFILGRLRQAPRLFKDFLRCAHSHSLADDRFFFNPDSITSTDKKPSSGGSLLQTPAVTALTTRYPIARAGNAVPKAEYVSPARIELDRLVSLKLMRTNRFFRMIVFCLL